MTTWKKQFIEEELSKSKEEGRQAGIEEGRLEGQILEMERHAGFLRSIIGIIDKPYKQDPKKACQLQLRSTQNGIKYFKELLEALTPKEST